MDSEQAPAAAPPAIPDVPEPSIHRVDRYAHLRDPNHKRGRGRPFARGDLRLRGGHTMEKLKSKLDRRSTSNLMHELTTNVLLAKSPKGDGEARIVRILCTLADKAEAGDNDAAEILFERFAGKVKPGDDAPSEGGRIVIEWDGPPPQWAPRPVLAAHAAQAPALDNPGADVPQKGPVVATAPAASCASPILEGEVVDADQS